MRTLYGTIFVAAVGVAISTAAGAEKVPAVAIHSATTNGVEVRWFEEMVPMKDGVRLYTYGALPPEGETRGIVFRRNPYVQEKPVDRRELPFVCPFQLLGHESSRREGRGAFRPGR